MTEIWQPCGSCNGAGGKEEQTAYVIEDPSGLNRPPQIRTAIQWIVCGTCLGTGQVRGGNR
ncbi:MAG TPA: hypothetical protein VIY48_09140 [Candidatus Paceibacterota bacterium]